MYKSLRNVALPITEEEYRNDGNFHYSTLATYERGGFPALATLGERKESPSLLFGSLVDCLITGTREEFDSLYLVAEYPHLEPANMEIAKVLFELYKNDYPRLAMIPEIDIITVSEQQNYHLNWKPETRAKVIKEKCEEYYSLLKIAENKTVVDAETYQSALNAVTALKEQPATKWYFADDNPFDNSLERVYQAKFKAEFEGITYSCMADLIVVDHTNKIVYPCDLKTSSHTEYEFFQSFMQWSYYIQAAEYAAILKDVLSKDEYFKDFTIMPYRFIVVNKNTLNPLVWEWPHTFDEGDITLTKSNGYPLILRNFKTIGKELKHYLEECPSVPNGISLTEPNNIEEWLIK